MAAGSIVVDLLMRTGSFETDTARGAAALRKLQREAEAVGRAVGLALAGAGIAAFAFAKSQINALDALVDLSDATGSTVENLSALERVANLNGQTLNDVSGIVIKFNNALKEADGKNGVSRALQAIGLDAKELKGLDPAEALRRTAVALAGFANDGNKARIVQELFGKSIREAGPFLKDLAEQGRLNATVTTEQAKQAEELNKQFFALQTNVKDIARGILGDLIPAVNDLIRSFIDLRANAVNGSLFQGIFGLSTQAKLTSEANALNAEITRTGKAIEFLQGQFEGGGRKDTRMAQEIKNLTGRMSELQKRTGAAAQQLKDLANLADPLKPDSRNPDYSNEGRIRRSIVLPDPTKPTRSPRSPRGSTADPLAEAKRYLESLERQLEKTRELSAVEQVLADIQAGRIKGIDAATAGKAFDLAAQIDQNKQIAESMRLVIETDKERIRQIVDAQNAVARESEALDESNQRYREQNEEIGATRETLFLIEKARISSAIAVKESALAEAQATDVTGLLSQELQKQIILLRERLGLVGQRQAFEDFNQAQEEITARAVEMNNVFKDSFADSFAGFLDGTKSAKDAFKDFANAVIADLARIAARQAAEQLFGQAGGSFGGSGSSEGWISQLVSWFGSFGGGRAAGGPVKQNKTYLVGERGPELFVPKQSGSIVPNHRIGKIEDDDEVLKKRPVLAERLGNLVPRLGRTLRDASPIASSSRGDSVFTAVRADKDRVEQTILAKSPLLKNDEAWRDDLVSLLGRFDVAQGASKINLVGERGPELFLPKESGGIVPNHRLKDLSTQVLKTGGYDLLSRRDAQFRADLLRTSLGGLPVQMDTQGPAVFVPKRSSDIVPHDRLKEVLKTSEVLRTSEKDREVWERMLWLGHPSFGGARALGGSVFKSKAYMVGEKGPELFIPQQSGGSNRLKDWPGDALIGGHHDVLAARSVAPKPVPSQLASSLGSSFGLGKMQMVGLKGPEMLIAERSGEIVPNEKLREVLKTNNSVLRSFRSEQKVREVWRDNFSWLGSFGGTRAKGGPAASNKTYVVGERGPEVFVEGDEWLDSWQGKTGPSGEPGIDRFVPIVSKDLPVLRPKGLTQIVGTQGPELFAPDRSGTIVTNNRLREVLKTNDVLRDEKESVRSELWRKDFHLLRSFGGARAQGGSVTSSKTYLVGEKGPPLTTKVRADDVLREDRRAEPAVLKSIFSSSTEANREYIEKARQVEQILNEKTSSLKTSAERTSWLGSSVRQSGSALSYEPARRSFQDGSDLKRNSLELLAPAMRVGDALRKDRPANLLDQVAVTFPSLTLPSTDTTRELTDKVRQVEQIIYDKGRSSPDVWRAGLPAWLDSSFATPSSTSTPTSPQDGPVSEKAPGKSDPLASLLKALKSPEQSVVLKNLLPEAWLASWLGLMWGGARAVGGPVMANKAYMVGERGPELFVPGQSGNVVPNNRLGGKSITVNVAMPQGATRETGQQFGAAIAQRLAIADRRNN